MQAYIINEYIKKLTPNDLSNYAQQSGINLSPNEALIIHQHLLKYQNNLIKGEHQLILEKLKQELKPSTYQQLKALYIQYVDKLS